MFSSNNSSNNFKPVISRLIFLAGLLPSISAFAATTVDETTQVKFVNNQATSLQSADPSTAIQRKQPAHKESNGSKSSSTQRVFKDDYERHLITVTKPKSTKMIWLGQNTQADSDEPSQSRAIWLRLQNRAD